MSWDLALPGYQQLCYIPRSIEGLASVRKEFNLAPYHMREIQAFLYGAEIRAGHEGLMMFVRPRHG